MKIIEDLYYGRISPYEMSISATPECQKLKALADRNEDLLRESLSDEQKEMLEKLIETVTDISSISERDMFITDSMSLSNSSFCSKNQKTTFAETPA